MTIEKIIGFGLIIFFLINFFIMINHMYREVKENNKSFFRMLITVPLELLLGTYGLYVALVMAALVFGLLYI